jgi:NAD(P)-dependent dehydrogenase (short-subunit alcohol dehydrogenase family)
MKTIVITGSTRGIGLALARAFLERGCRVFISGRKQESLQQCLQELANDYPAEHLGGIICDVQHYDQLQQLWQQAKERFGSIDIWVNNAGISNYLAPPWDVPAEELKCVITTNVLGEMYGTKVAMNGFQQQGYGALYNMEGMGAKDGRKVAGLSIYGASKAALGYFNDALFMENKHPKILVGALQPGMVLTDMVMSQYENTPREWEKVKGILTALCGEVNAVAAFLAEKILANTKNGVRIRYGSTFRTMVRMLRRKLVGNR